MGFWCDWFGDSEVCRKWDEEDDIKWAKIGENRIKKKEEKERLKNLSND